MNKYVLNKMLDDLHKCKGNTKEDIMMRCVSERLRNSEMVYEKELGNSLNYLSRKNELRMIRKLNKL